MIGRLAFMVIVAGACMILVRPFGWATGNWYELGGVLLIVLGALVIAIRGEEAEEELVQHNRRRTDTVR